MNVKVSERLTLNYAAATAMGLQARPVVIDGAVRRIEALCPVSGVWSAFDHDDPEAVVQMLNHVVGEGLVVFYKAKDGIYHCVDKDLGRRVTGTTIGEALANILAVQVAQEGAE